jgi:hypothetical protein
MYAATVWGWGERFEDVGRNCKKHVDKRWKKNIKECKIEIMARERNDGVCYWLTVYLSSPRDVEKIAEDLFYTALFKGDTKVDFVNTYLFDSMVSNKVVCRKSIDEVRNEFDMFIKEVAKRFRSDSKIEPIAKVKKVEFNVDVCLICELESTVANKVVIDAIHWDFELLSNFVKSLIDDLIEKELASRVLGYGLRTGSTDSLEIVDIGQRKEMVFVRLERRNKLFDKNVDS